MKILIFNWRDIKHPWAGGAEVCMWELAKRFVTASHQVTFFCSDHFSLKKKETLDGVKIVRCGGRFSVYFFAPLIYWLRLRKETDVIIDCQNGIPFFTPFFSRKKKICFVHHISGQQFFAEFWWPLSWIGYFIESKIAPVCYKNITFVAVSLSTKKALIHLGIPEQKIHIIYNGVDHNKYKPDFAKKTPYFSIIYLGRIKKYKCLDLLLKIFNDVLKTVPNAKLFIAGSGDDEARIKELAVNLNLVNSVKFIGYVDETTKVNLLQSAWVMVSASLVEGWGLSVIEANACGTPAISFDVPGLRDAIVNGQTGYLVKSPEEMVEKIMALFKNKNLLEKSNQRSIEWANKFNWDKSIQELTQILTTQSSELLKNNAFK